MFRNPETMWHSRDGSRHGGSNVTGLSIPEVDALIETEKGMMSAADRENAYRRIDSLVAAAVPYVLLWHTDEHRILYWNKFGTPATVLGRLGGEEGALAYWWYDEDRAEELSDAVKDGGFLPNVPLRVDFDDVRSGAGR